jgi:hypothetical protein
MNPLQTISRYSFPVPNLSGQRSTTTMKEEGMAKEATKQAAAPQVQANSTGTGRAHEEIAALAYSVWQARGCPEGTPEEDWFNAERTLKSKSEA